MHTILTVAAVWVGVSIPASVLFGFVIRAGDTERMQRRPQPLPLRTAEHGLAGRRAG